MHKTQGLTFRRVAALKRRTWLDLPPGRIHPRGIGRAFDRLDRERRMLDVRDSDRDHVAAVRAA